MLTESAVVMIERLRAEAHGEVDRDDDLGLRICSATDGPGLRMSLATAPGPDDLVVADPRATVYLDPVAAARLDGDLLDARSDENGSAFFLGG